MKPHVILNCAMSLNGKIGKEGERVRLSNEEDKKRVHELRSKVDAIMVGINTILTDNPKLTAHHAEEKRNPTRVVIDSKARTPMDANVLNQKAETIIAMSEKASPSRRKKLKKKAEVISTGKERVNLTNLLERLEGKGIKKILLEGGGTLNKSMIEEGLVDEIYVTVAPTLLEKGISIINGELDSEVRMRLSGINQLGDQVILHYEL